MADEDRKPRRRPPRKPGLDTAASSDERQASPTGGGDAGGGGDQSGALVFDSGEAPVDGATFVGQVPAEEVPTLSEPKESLAPPEPAVSLTEKTQILSSAGAAKQEIPVLTIEMPDGSKSDVEVGRDSFVLGRAPDCDVVIPDSLCSRRHAIVERHPDGWYLIDQSSGNGTILNERKITRELLYDGDVFQIGDAVITFTGSGSGTAPLEATRMLPATEMGTGLIPAATGDKSKHVDPAAAKRRKLLIAVSAVAAVIGVLAIVKKLSAPTEVQAPAVNQQQAALAEARAKAEQAAKEKLASVRELTRAEKWAEAAPLIEEVAKVLTSDEVKQYQSTIQLELETARTVGQAKELLEKNDFEGALAALAKVPADNAKRADIGDLRKKILDKQVEAAMAEAKAAMDEKRYDDAIPLLDRVLALKADHPEAGPMKAEAERKKGKPKVALGPHTPKPPPAPRPPKRSPFLLWGKSLELYGDNKLDEALSQAPSSGVSDEGVRVLQQLRTEYRRGLEWKNNKGQIGQYVEYLKTAFELDRRLSGGKGLVSEDLRSQLSKACFFQGSDAFQGQRYPLAYKALTDSLNFDPSMKMAEKRLRELEGEAKKLFETAYVIAASSPEKAISNCQTVTQMVAKDYPYYKKCQDLIRKLRDPGAGQGDDDDGF